MQTEKRMSAEHLINLLICALGVILVLVGIIFVKRQDVSTVTISVGASLIASSIVAYLSSIYIQRYRRAKEISEIWGISSVEERREIMNLRVDEETKTAKHYFDLIAFGLKSLREGNNQGVIDLLNRGVSIRILTVDPDCDLLRIRDLQEDKQEGDTAHSIRQLKDWAEDLGKKYPGKIELRYSRYIPTEYYQRVDDYIYVGPYQHGKESQRTITAEFRNPGKAFAYYESYFNSLWDDKNYCRSID